MPQCRLCLKDRKLCDSHIIPEFLYSGLYNDKHQMMGINGAGTKGWKPLQKGITEKLFCEPCEQHFSNHVEAPFKSDWCDKFPLPDPWPTDHVELVRVRDYRSFKLFHLSIIFRAGVSTSATFAQVQLGAHEERMRQLLLGLDPGRADRYSVFGYAVVRHDNHRIVQMVSPPRASSFGNRPCYGTIYAGVQWWVRVTSSAHREFEAVSLREDGSMSIAAAPWHELSALQDASKALRRADAARRKPEQS